MTYIFYCDESYDPPKSKEAGSKSYVVGGFFGDERVWLRVERRWREKNDRVHITRFHASQLNAGMNAGKSKNWRVRYSRDMLRILKDQKRRLHGFACGIYADDYRSIITPEGQKKMGHPYLVCFKTVICRIAGFMSRPNSGFAPGDHFSVVLDRNDLADKAVEVFYKMKVDAAFVNSSRLDDCVTGGAELFVGLQPADFVAYETFRLMHGKRNDVVAIRQALNGMFGTTGFFGDLFDDRVFRRIRDDVDTMPSLPDGFVIVPPRFEPDEEQPG